MIVYHIFIKKLEQNLSLPQLIQAIITGKNKVIKVFAMIGLVNGEEKAEIMVNGGGFHLI